MRRRQALPVFRNVIEAVTYALFPLLVLLLLLTSGREMMIAFKGYAAILIWIQLWPPLYAVLNYMASIYAAYDLAAAADCRSKKSPCARHHDLEPKVTVQRSEQAHGSAEHDEEDEDGFSHLSGAPARQSTCQSFLRNVQHVVADVGNKPPR